MSATPDSPDPAALVVVANQLASGRTVFQRADGRWSDSLHAALVHTEEKTAELAVQQAGSEPTLVIDAYLVRLDEAARPEQLREAIRVSGPTILPPTVLGHTASTQSGPPAIADSGVS